MTTTTMLPSGRARLFNDAETGLYHSMRGHGDYPTSNGLSNGLTNGNGTNNGHHGSKCFCCPYGYHIDLDFVRYCENWQAAASDRIARGNEEKRRRRQHRKQCHSMEFLLGLPDDKENKPVPIPATKPAPPKPPPKPNLDSIKSSKDWQDTLSNFEEALSQSYTGPSSSSVCSTPVSNNYFFSTSVTDTLPNGRTPHHQEPPHHQNYHQNHYQNHHRTISPQESSAAALVAHQQRQRQIEKQRWLEASPEPEQMLEEGMAREEHYSAEEEQDEEVVVVEEEPHHNHTRELAKRVEASVVEVIDGAYSADGSGNESSGSNGVTDGAAAAVVGGGGKPCLRNVREQMAAALERMRQLEQQVNEIPLLHVQMAVLREERRILLRQLAASNKLQHPQPIPAPTPVAPVQPAKRHASTSCATVTRDIGVSHQQTKTRESSTNTRSTSLGSYSLERLSVPPESRPEQRDKGSQCIDLQRSAVEKLRIAVGVQCEPESKPRLSNSFSQCDSPVRWPVGVQCVLPAKETRETGVQSESSELSTSFTNANSMVLQRPSVHRKNKEVQATDTQPAWSKLRLSTGVTAKPSVSDASTETSDASISLLALRRCQQLGYTRSIGVDCTGLVQFSTRGTDPDPKTTSSLTTTTTTTTTPSPKKQKTATRESATSPQRRLLVDAAVQSSPTSTQNAATTSGNYCDECKQISKSLSSEKNRARSVDRSAGGKPRTRIPVMSPSAMSAGTGDSTSNKGSHATTTLTRHPTTSNLIRQDTWSEGLDQLGKESEVAGKCNGDGKQTPDKRHQQEQQSGHNNLAKTQKLTVNNTSNNKENECKSVPSNVTKIEGNFKASDTIEPVIATSEVDSASIRTGTEFEDDDSSLLSCSMLLETPKVPGKRPPMQLSRELQAALKVLGDNLRKVSSGGTLPSKIKNASNMVQHEWFKVSSTAGADPLTVEFYLDQFEQHSSALLAHVVNLTDSSGNTAMHYAVSHANFDVVSILIDSKVCDVNRQNNAGYTPVMLAALAQLRNSTHASVVKRLFHIADVNVRARLHGQTALMLAVSHGRKDMSRLLLEAGAAVNLQDEDGSTALMCAAEHGHGDIVRLLLSQLDCDSSIVDVDGSSALKIALEAGHADIGVLLYAHQRASRASPMPPVGGAGLQLPRPAKRHRTNSSSSSVLSAPATSSRSTGLLPSMSAPASPVANPANRKFHSSSLSLVDSAKYSL
ncbi:hypothetical protein QAD02_017567 [Eretmocerus hayati]|uniref:Uncharacterized protein n=1 Tax=Eretmocerus hayati TaxID=131215 RepID=A0ACC2PDZ0_9HYME|nr:hypothetical protein QAD02_017567 [Eretmocerus hayati]